MSRSHYRIHFFSLLLWMGLHVFAIPTASAQPKKIDSLETVLRKYTGKTGYTADTSRFKLLMDIGGLWQGVSLDSADKYHSRAKAIAEALKDELRQAEALNGLGWNRYASGDYQKALSNFKTALKLVEKNMGSGDPKKEKNAMTIQASLLGNLGNYYGNQGQYKTGIDYFNRALRINEKMKNKKGMASKYSNMGNLYGDMGDYQKALSCYFSALKLANEVNHQPLQMVSYTNIGSTYMTIRQNETALRYFMKAQKLADQLGNKMAQSANLTNIGIIYHEKKDFDNALKYYTEAVNLDIVTGNRHSQANNLLNIGSLYQDKKQFKKGLGYYLEAEKIFKEINSVHGLSGVLCNIGLSYIDLGQLDRAEKYLLDSYKMAIEQKSIDLLKDSHNHLAVLYELKHQPAKALYHYKEYILYRDSIFNEENTRINLQKEMQFNYDKKAAADSVKFAKEKELRNIRFAKQEAEFAKQEAELRARRTQQYLLYGGLALVLVFALFIFNRFRVTQKQKVIIEQKEKETREQKHIIEEKHKEITDSINYAKRIQYTLLAQDELLKEYLGQHFVLFKPKDIVSGDFYWATRKIQGSTFNVHGDEPTHFNPETLNVEQTNQSFYLAVCDSTGHGVPGAFMSLLNISFLNEAINEKNISDPARVFDHVRQRLIENISQEGQKDGMDGILVKFHPVAAGSKLEIEYAAANNAPILVRNHEAMELPCDKMPVGRGESSRNFTSHRFELQKGDTLYLLTDGYTDQFGGPKGKKFKHNNLVKLLAEVSEKPIQDQMEYLINEFTRWQGELEQVDDVCIVGIRI